MKKYDIMVMKKSERFISMLNKIAVNLSKRLLSHNMITEETFDIYVYGFELLISSLFSTVTVLLIGSILGKILQTLAFLITFILLRSCTGGYHANTYFLCSLVTFSSFGLVLTLSELLFIPIYVYLLFALSGVVIVLLFAPVENPNKKLTDKKRIRFKIVSFILFVIIVSFGICIKNVAESVSNVIFFALLADIILLFIKNKKGRRITNEGC